MYHLFIIQNFHFLTTLYLCLLYGSQNNERLFPYKTISDWYIYNISWLIYTYMMRFKSLQPSGQYMHHQINIKQFHVFPKRFCSGFCGSEQTANITLYNSNCLVYIADKEHCTLQWSLMYHIINIKNFHYLPTMYL